jgi:hypothetical protein
MEDDEDGYDYDDHECTDTEDTEYDINNGRLDSLLRDYMRQTHPETRLPEI